MPLLPALAVGAALLGAALPTQAPADAPAAATPTSSVSSQCSTGSSVWVGILSSTTVQTARPHVEGIAEPGTRIEFRDSLGNTYGSAVADDDWDFSLDLTRDLKPGYTQLVVAADDGSGCGLTPVGFTRTA